MPNVLWASAFDTTKLDAFVATSNDMMLGESDLTRLEREMIAVVVSLINRCWYCQVAHGRRCGSSRATRRWARRW